jgi:hypothetical protein
MAALHAAAPTTLNFQPAIDPAHRIVPEAGDGLVPLRPLARE